MLQPARTKYRKQQKGRNTGVATRGNVRQDFGYATSRRGVDSRRFWQEGVQPIEGWYGKLADHAVPSRAVDWSASLTGYGTAGK